MRHIKAGTVVADLTVMKGVSRRVSGGSRGDGSGGGSGDKQWWYELEYRDHEAGMRYTVDTSTHWVGLINHLPMPPGDVLLSDFTTSEQEALHKRTSNLVLRDNGKLEATRDVAPGEQLTFDYGIQYWVHRVTGGRWAWWQQKEHRAHCRLLHNMHDTVLDYTRLLNMQLDDGLWTGENGEPEDDSDILQMLSKLQTALAAERRVQHE